MVRDGKPKGVFYLDHRTVDGRPGMITDTHTTQNIKKIALTLAKTAPAPA